MKKSRKSIKVTATARDSKAFTITIVANGVTVKIVADSATITIDDAEVPADIVSDTTYQSEVLGCDGTILHSVSHGINANPLATIILRHTMVSQHQFHPNQASNTRLLPILRYFDELVVEYIPFRVVEEVDFGYPCISLVAHTG